MIRCAKILEIPEILRLTTACAKQMKKIGIFQWNEEYPSREAFEKDIPERNYLFLNLEILL